MKGIQICVLVSQTCVLHIHVGPLRICHKTSGRILLFCILILKIENRLLVDFLSESIIHKKIEVIIDNYFSSKNRHHWQEVDKNNGCVQYLDAWEV